ncbi:hypothetical protein [Ramlibacter sp. 2FC]|uniref:hypothetical protein n=1 Tax=Ramlibacter sp. 2FC TaxID=2502188 RepID=UPI0010F769ED|nr:hypothetical protein [Ramlibacter sp. 2FC]
MPLVRTRVGSLPAVVLGDAQRELWSEPAAPARVRASAGSAILSGPWLLRTVVLLPRAHGLLQGGPSAAAGWFGEVHRRWLQAQGIAGAAVYLGRKTQHWACFAERAPGEVVVGERKIVGIAQAWLPGGLLLSSGVLLSPPPWSLLCSALHRPYSATALLEALSVSAADCLGRAVDAQAWADGLRYALRLALSLAGVAAPGSVMRAETVAPLATCLGLQGPVA